MVKKGQKSVTIPEWVWEEAEEYFKANEEELKFKNVTSVTGLITLWILQSKRATQGEE